MARKDTTISDSGHDYLVRYIERTRKERGDVNADAQLAFIARFIRA